MEVYNASKMGLKICLALLETYVANQPNPMHAKTRLNMVREKYDGLIIAYENVTEENSGIEREIEVLWDRYFKVHEIASDLCGERKFKTGVPIVRENTLDVNSLIINYLHLILLNIMFLHQWEDFS